MRKLYYKLTKYLPRRLPETEEEFEALKEIMVKAYGLEDHPKTWYMLASQMMAGPPTSLYRSYGKMANAARKLRVSALVSIEHGLANEQMRVRLEKKAKEVANAFTEEAREESLPSQGELRIETGDVS